MGYDFHTPYTEPGPVAPLTGEKSIVSYLANYLQRVPADKIILGIPIMAMIGAPPIPPLIQLRFLLMPILLAQMR